MECFAYNYDGLKGCKALTIKNCNDCSFRKTKEEADKAVAQAIERIKSLDETQVNYINEKYSLKIRRD